MIPAQRGHPERRPRRDLEVVERVRSPALADVEGDQRDERDRAEHERRCLPVRHGREVDREDQRADEHEREDAAEVVDRLGPLVHVRRDEEPGHQDRDDRERQREQEDRAPVEVLEQEPREHRAECGDRAADARPQRDRLRAAGARSPERRDQRERRRVGHAGSDASADTRDEQHGVGRRVGGEQGERESRAPSPRRSMSLRP